MKKSIYLFATLIAALFVSSCGSDKGSKAVEDEISDALTLDEIFETPEKYVGDTITIEGICSHLCAHGGRKAFIQGNADNIQIRCEAFPLMGEPFAQNTIHHPLKVTGIFVEERIDYDVVDEMERSHNERIQQIAGELGDELAQKADNATVGCDTERAAQGQQDLNTFKERMDDYRKRIAEREAVEGKPYLQFYHIDAISYEIVE